MKRSRLRRRTRLRKVRPRRGKITDRMLDDACRAVVFARDGHRCMYTGSTAHLQWAHVYSRRYRSIRWDPDNSMCLSAGAHLLWHAQPAMMVQWWVSRVGQQFADNLRARLLKGEKVDREALLAHLKAMLEKHRTPRHEVEGSGEA